MKEGWEEGREGEREGREEGEGREGGEKGRGEAGREGGNAASASYRQVPWQHPAYGSLGVSSQDGPCPGEGECGRSA